MNASQLPDLAGYPAVQRMVREHLDMQFEDVRSMLRLPAGDLAGGCNFTAAAMLTNLVGGFSVVLYDDPDPTMPLATQRSRRGDRFRHLLVDHFPHDPVLEPPKATVVDVIYTFARNSLTHALGLRQPGEPEINLCKRPLTPDEIETIERSQARPARLVGAIVAQRGVAAFDVSVIGLYWATFRLLETLVTNNRHIAFAERELHRGAWVP